MLLTWKLRQVAQVRRLAQLGRHLGIDWRGMDRHCHLCCWAMGKLPTSERKSNGMGWVGMRWGGMGGDSGVGQRHYLGSDTSAWHGEHASVQVSY